MQNKILRTLLLVSGVFLTSFLPTTSVAGLDEDILAPVAVIRSHQPNTRGHDSTSRDIVKTELQALDYLFSKDWGATGPRTRLVTCTICMRSAVEIIEAADKYGYKPGKIAAVERLAAKVINNVRPTLWGYGWTTQLETRTGSEILGEIIGRLRADLVQ